MMLPSEGALPPRASGATASRAPVPRPRSDLARFASIFGGAPRILRQKPVLGRPVSRLDALAWRAPRPGFFDF